LGNTTSSHLTTDRRIIDACYLRPSTEVFEFGEQAEGYH